MGVEHTIFTFYLNFFCSEFRHDFYTIFARLFHDLFSGDFLSAKAYWTISLGPYGCRTHNFYFLLTSNFWLRHDFYTIFSRLFLDLSSGDFLRLPLLACMVVCSFVE